MKFIFHQYILGILTLSFSINGHTQIPQLGDTENDYFSNSIFKSNRSKSVIFSFIPGLEPIYNQKYWKLPIVYAGLLSGFYSIYRNNKQYHSYKDAYLDFIHNNNSPFASEKKYIPNGFSNNIWKLEIYQKNAFANFLKNGQNLYREYRDLSFIITNGLYILCIIDAYVDIQLLNFDINEDLSFKTKPIFLTMNSSSFHLGLQCRILF